uniref:Uncharacterized protein n=1 Tax=Strigamia maritima TaxID=126957 RepID=T1JPJ5_STRMM
MRVADTAHGYVCIYCSLGSVLNPQLNTAFRPRTTEFDTNNLIFQGVYRSQSQIQSRTRLGRRELATRIQWCDARSGRPGALSRLREDGMMDHERDFDGAINLSTGQRSDSTTPNGNNTESDDNEQQQQHQLAELGRKQMEQILQQLQEQLQINMIQQSQLMQQLSGATPQASATTAVAVVNAANSIDKKQQPNKSLQAQLQQLALQQQQLMQQLQLMQRQYLLQQGIGLQPVVIPQ